MDELKGMSLDISNKHNASSVYNISFSVLNKKSNGNSWLKL